MIDYVSHGAAFCRSSSHYWRRVDLCSWADTLALALSRPRRRHLEAEIDRHDIPSSLSPAPSPNRCWSVWICVCQVDAERDRYPDCQRGVVHRLRDIQHDTWMDIDGARTVRCVDSNSRLFRHFRSSYWRFLPRLSPRLYSHPRSIDFKTSIDFETFWRLARWSSIQQAIEPEATRTKLRTLGNAIPPRLILNGGILWTCS